MLASRSRKPLSAAPLVIVRGASAPLPVIPGTAPLLEEPRALDQLGWLVTGWCDR
jgi:hypothetical protein